MFTTKRSHLLHIIINYPRTPSVHYPDKECLCKNKSNWKTALAGGLLIFSEILPFAENTEINGILHGFATWANKAKNL